MNRITKFTLAALAASALGSAPLFADAGIFGTSAIVSFTIGGSTTNDVLEATLLNDTRQQPTHPTISPLSYDMSGDDANNTLNLGTFYTTNGDSLTFDGGEVLTYKSGSDNFTGADVYYSIDGGSFTQVGLGFDQDNVDGHAGDQRWYLDSDTANLLSGLSFGTHTLSFKFDATDNFGGSSPYVPVVNNGGANYTATFTVVPEPSSFMMLLSSSALGSFYLIRRRRA